MKKIFVFLLLLLSTISITAQTVTTRQSRVFVFTQITVIDVENGLELPGMTVVVTGDKISAVGKFGRFRLPSNAQIIQAKGKYLIPGLWDMHVHLSVGGQEMLPLLVANGVTGVRDMGGDLSLIKSYRERIAGGRLLGPKIKAAGQIIEDANWLKKVQSLPIPEIQAYLKANPRLGIATPEEARKAVNTLTNEGVDTVKIRNAPSREVYLALADEAKKRGLALVGHLPPGIGLIDASDAGQKSIEHVTSLALGKDLDKLFAEQRNELFARLVRNGTWFTPTLVAEQYQGATEATMSPLIEGKTGVHADRHRFTSPKLLDFWRLQNALTKYNSPGQDLAAIVSKGTERLRELHRAKMPMLAGTDLGAMLVYPGLAVHDELELLVTRIGMTPAEALRTATLNPAVFFEMEDKTGTIKAGKTADLVVLDANPLQNISNTKRINAVVVDGRYLPREKLESTFSDYADFKVALPTRVYNKCWD